MAEHWLDRSRHPIWVQTFPRHYGDKELAEAFDHLDHWVEYFSESGVTLSLISDISRVPFGNPLHRKRISKTFKRTTARMGERVGGQAFIVRNLIQQGAMIATLWLFRPPWPIGVYSEKDEAFKWLEGVHAKRARRRPA